MPTQTRAAKGKPDHAWRTDWPTRGDLKAWMLCMLRKREALSSVVEAADESHLPIEQLARLGAVPAALRTVDRLLARLAPQDVLATVRLALVGAQIALDAGKQSRMERYLRAQGGLLTAIQHSSGDMKLNPHLNVVALVCTSRALTASRSFASCPA